MCVFRLLLQYEKETRFWVGHSVPLLATAAIATATATANATFTSTAGVFLSVPALLRRRLDHSQSWPALIRHNPDRAGSQ